MSYIIASLIAYLLGSLSSAILVCKLLGLRDPRTEGSGNPGATNVLRLGGKGAALITLLGDMLKGVIPVLAAKWLGLNSVAIGLVAFFAFIGHLYPIFFRFHGGKGVATALGCLLALAWPVGVSAIITWLVIAILFRYSSLASLLAFLLAPFYTWYFTANTIYLLTVAVISMMLIYRHRENIQRLIQGKETKLYKSSNDQRG